MQADAKKKALRQKLFEEDKKKETQAKLNAAGPGATMEVSQTRLQKKINKKEKAQQKKE